MAGNFSSACRRVLRRAVAVGSGTLCLAIAAGVVAGFTASPPGIPSAHDLAAALMSPAAELRSGEHVGQRTSNGDGSRPMVIAVNSDVFTTAQELNAAEMAEPEPTAEPVAATLARVERPPVERPPTEHLQVGARVEATLSYYYCEQGQQPRGIGDGGGFCMHMRNGEIVYPGAAACAHAYLGQRFRIVGDPLERVYDCADTGSAVHGQHRDIWFMNSDDGMAWQAQVGTVAIIEILE